MRRFLDLVSVLLALALGLPIYLAQRRSPVPCACWIDPRGRIRTVRSGFFFHERDQPVYNPHDPNPPSGPRRAAPALVRSSPPLYFLAMVASLRPWTELISPRGRETVTMA